MKTSWNPNQYEKFKAQRSKPFFDLASLIEEEQFGSAIDLGCGTGELTRVLFDRIKPESMLAIDSSPEMLERAKKFETKDLNFQLANISDFLPCQKFDLLFSNAALQWLPNHEDLFPKLLSWVSDRGQVAIQMPFNFDHPSHTIAVDVAHIMFPKKFSKKSNRENLALGRYAEILFAAGFDKQITRIEVYGHRMTSGLEVLEWTKGTLLTSYQSELSDGDFKRFLSEYQTQLLRVIGEGPYFYAFKRALLWGKRND